MVRLVLFGTILLSISVESFFHGQSCGLLLRSHHHHHHHCAQRSQTDNRSLLCRCFRRLVGIFRFPDCHFGPLFDSSRTMVPTLTQTRCPIVCLLCDVKPLSHLCRVDRNPFVVFRRFGTNKSRLKCCWFRSLFRLKWAIHACRGGTLVVIVWIGLVVFVVDSVSISFLVKPKG